MHFAGPIRGRVEQLADIFASALLMPSAALETFGDWTSLDGDALVTKLNDAAEALGVTAVALKWRLVSAGRLPKTTAQAMDDARLRHNGRTDGRREPPPLFSRPFADLLAQQIVMDCVTETQTGFQNRRPEQRIDEAELRGSLAVVHAVSDAERAVALVRDELVRFLDPGEQALWAHALGRNDAWLLGGPNKASVRLALRDRMVAPSSQRQSGARPARRSGALRA